MSCARNFVSLLLVSGSMVTSPLSSQAADFSGVSIGFGIGGVFSGAEFDHVERNGAGVELNREHFSVNPNALAGGVHVGYQHQFGRFLLGIEGSYTAFTATDAQATNLNGFPRSREAKVKDQLAIAARLGIVTGDWLTYAKVGVAMSELEFHNYRSDTGADLGLSKNTERGLLFGAGVEYSLHSNWTLGLDYTGVDFNVSNTFMKSPTTGAVFTTSNDNIDLMSHTVMGRLTYRFGHHDTGHDSLK